MKIFINELTTLFIFCYLIASDRVKNATIKSIYEEFTFRQNLSYSDSF